MTLMFLDALEKIKIKYIKHTANQTTSAANRQHSEQGVATAKDRQNMKDAVYANLT